jgi:hypothetical protein
MSAINLLLAGLGGGITLMVAIGMVFLTPRGVETLVETPYERPRPGAGPELELDLEVAPHV